MKIHGLAGLTLLDFPGKMACTVFTGYCNFRCPFCHNATLVLNPSSQPLISKEEIFSLLDKRKGKLNGVAITGGEPTLQPDLPEFCKAVKDKGFSVKLDTNGSSPDMVRQLINDRLVDYIAMDIKASPENYSAATGIRSFDMSPIFDCVDIILGEGENGCINYEFRTTVVGGIHTENDFIKISRWLKGAKAYFLQGYRSSEDQLNPEGLGTVPLAAMERYRDILLENIPNTQLRGVI